MMSRQTPAWAVLLLVCAGSSAPFAQSNAVSPETSRNSAPDVAASPFHEKTASDWRASQLIGTTMTNILDESIGKVEDVVIDSDGKVVAVLVGVGGFLGLGETTVAIGLRHLVISHADTDRLEVKTSLSRKAIEQAATIDPNDDKPVAP
jgi:sporulation protein YlmC with PRC-barrel domain